MSEVEEMKVPKVVYTLLDEEGEGYGDTYDTLKEAKEECVEQGMHFIAEIRSILQRTSGFKKIP